ncbi:neuroblast differentiation-associated protein AHNAK isoform X4 [Etheostoma cragini]|uniref:neuroblast differentiation-associated protein AHNAK isoform X3 n=1 Tax=Etheostoma cragini TaxID=417921 RepID=UPI00155E8F4B|nr:neuroblast differentiation-associated protein AHNAK isoform X3 [Etheostoma cragini]XP_034756628.1 neuroblast differentiation-associated protein AHNAK isoform X4 [Etheostoma cragini]
MLSHRRGRSLSESLILEQSDEGGLVVSSIDNNSSANQGLREGDELLGATINFDQLSKTEVLNVLKMMEPFDGKVHVLTRNNLSKSLGNLDQCAKTPETMLNDSYNKLYNAKIKKFMKDDFNGAMEGSVNKEVTPKSTVPGSSKVNLKHNMGLPRCGVDFGLMKKKTLAIDDDAGELSYDSNLNLPPMGLGSNRTTLSGAQVPRLKVNARSPQFNAPDVGIQLPDTDSPSLDLTMPNLERTQFGLESNGTFRGPEMGMDLKGSGLTTSDMGISGPSFSGPEGEVQLPDVGTPDVPSGKLGLKYSKRLKNPNLNVDNPTGYVESPRLRLSGGSPDLDLEMPGVDVSQLDIQRPGIDMPSGKVKLPFKKPKIDLKSSDLNVDAPSGKLTMPKFGFSGKGEVDGKTPDLSLETPKIKGGIHEPNANLPKVDLKGPKLAVGTPSGAYEAPSFKMPKFNLPGIQVPSFNGDLDGPDVRLAAPELKARIADPNIDIDSQDLSLKAPKIKGGFDAPDLDLPNMNLKSPKLDVNTPDLNIGSPKAKFKMPKMKMPKFGLPNRKGPEIDGSFDGPDVDVTVPNVNLEGPKADVGMPDFDVSGPSGKFKKPNLNLPGFGLSGPKLNSPNLDLKTPDLDISGPNLSGGLNAPDINMPKVDLKSPKLDLNTPKLNLPSGKMKMPELHAPDWDVNAPSGKLKMPKLNLSGTLPKGPNMDIDSPDLSLKAPKIKGGLDAPDLDLPNMNLKSPKLDVNTPDLNIGSPKGKTKMPKMKMPKFNVPNLKGPEIDGNFDGPDIDMNAPNINLKGPKGVDFGGPSGKIKKPHLKIPDVGFSSRNLDGPNFDLNSDLKTPDFNVKAPKLKGGFDAPKMGLNMPSVNTPDLSFSGPKAKIPDMNLSGPKLKGPSMSVPDLDLPDASFKGPKLDLNAKSPDLGINGNVGGPDMNFTAPNVKGGLRGPEAGIQVPSGNIHGLQNDLDLPDRKFNAPSFKLPQFGGLDLNRAETDFDFETSRKSTNLDFSPPNAKLNMKQPQLEGDFTGPNVSVPKMPKGAMQGPQLHLKSPDLNIDDSSRNFRVPSYSNRRSDIPGVNMRMPFMDVDGDVGLRHTDGQSSRTKVRSSYPQVDAGFGDNIPYNHSDLNIDDFTEKHHVPKARGAELGFQPPPNYGKVNSPVNIDMRDPRHTRTTPSGDVDVYSRHHRTTQQESRARLQNPKTQVPDSSDGYYVTVFPNQAQPQRMPNRKYNTLGGPDFHSGDLDLDVPRENDLKGGSTFFFSNLM